ncbi:MAG: hypothetical protein SFU99_09460, partial [Saprospiraceae bacterium]|nr:hypothetical protein [Saprospiraceae bacterium]
EFNKHWVERKEQYDVNDPETACAEFDKMLVYTVGTLENKWNLTFEDVLKHEIKAFWGQVFDLEQMLEHAIVHILRHRRQIERFLLKMNAVS